MALRYQANCMLDAIGARLVIRQETIPMVRKDVIIVIPPKDTKLTLALMFSCCCICHDDGRGQATRGQQSHVDRSAFRIGLFPC